MKTQTILLSLLIALGGVSTAFGMDKNGKARDESRSFLEGEVRTQNPAGALSMLIALGGVSTARGQESNESGAKIPWKLFGITFGTTVRHLKHDLAGSIECNEKFEYYWPNIFKATIAIGVPVSLYAFAKNYTWLNNNQFWNMFKR